MFYVIFTMLTFISFRLLFASVLCFIFIYTYIFFYRVIASFKQENISHYKTNNKLIDWKIDETRTKKMNTKRDNDAL